MHWKSLLLGAALAAGATIVAQRAFSEDPPKSEPPKSEPTPEDVQRMLQPGPAQKALEAYVGKWDGTGTFQEPGQAQPITWTSTGDYAMVLGGRFLRRDETMTVAGAPPIRNVAFNGHDNIRNVAMSFAMGTDSTTPSYSEGRHDDEKHALVFRGSEAVAPNRSRTYEIVVSDVVNDSFTVEVSFDGQSVAHGKYTRKRVPAAPGAR